MTRLLEVFRFELAYQFRRASTVAYFLIVLSMCTALMHVMAGGTRNDGNFNAPFTVMAVVVFGSMLALAMMAAFAGDAAARDADLRIASFFYTSPAGKRAYLLGRFLGAFAMSALLLLAFPAGCMLATWMPWVDPSSLGPFRLSAYLAPYLLYALPNAFVATAVLFGAASLARRATASYAAAAFLFFTAVICGKLLGPRLGLGVATLLDPLGFTTLGALLLSLTPLQKNTFVLVLDSALLTNRLLWLGIATTVLAAAYAHFRLAHHAVGHEGTTLQSKAADDSRVEVMRSVPAARRVFDTSTRLRQLRAIAMRSFRELHTSRVWWIVPILALLFILQAPELARNEMGVPGPLTTARLVEFLTGDISVLLTLLIALSAGELVWRERSARIHALAGVTPVPDSLAVTGSFLGLTMMLAATLTIFLVAGIAVQTVFGADRYDLALYIQLLYGLLLPEYLLFAALAMIVHVLVNQKYVANVLVVLAPVARDVVRRLGVEDNLLLYGNLPGWMHSEIAGFGPAIEPRLWFTLYFGGWALLFALATYLFWIRGEEHHPRQRLALARRRVTRGAATLGATALAIIAGAGGFIFYNTHILHDRLTTTETEQRRAEYERRYGRHASLPQPAIAATKLHVDFYPRRRAATINGSYRLENRSSARIDAIHVVSSGGADTSTVSFDRPSRLTVNDDDLDYRVYALDRALAPGESLRMHFALTIETQPFSNYGTAPVVRNGSFLTHRPRNGDHWLPLVGYQAPRELNDPVVRKKYGLRERSPYPRLGDVAVGNEQNGYETIEFEAIVGTDAGQVGVAPGTARRTWTENPSTGSGQVPRRYIHYLAEVPISNAWTITSANYAVHRARWRNVNIEIFHHPIHTANLERMVRGVQASLEHNTRAFGPYPYRQVRLVEFPSHPAVVGMTAHSGLITYAEGSSLIRPADDPRNIDFPFAVVAHEMGHQWWGHQLTPAVVEGAPFLAESLSWYSAMLVVEETLGRDHLRRLLGMMRADYMQPHQTRTIPLLRAVDQTDAYRRGPFAMYALREAVGVEPVNRALRNLLSKFPPGREPYPTSLDFYAELRAVTPAPMHGLLKDLFEEVTFWELSVKGIDVKPDGKGAYRVMLHIDAQKLKGDSTGTERPVPMNDPVEILVYDGHGKPLYRASHRLRSGEQAFELLVPRPPAGAVVDPDHELLDRQPADNEVRVGGG
ncbi:MAG TPA: M1 family aminopeptidase [Thermoanaerobaculia bacterium]|jgi:ABC-type transport system involved in multi-copper enzyme maturation permease subunit